MSELVYTSHQPQSSQLKEEEFALSYVNSEEPIEPQLFEEKGRGFSFLSFSASFADEKRTIPLRTEKEERQIEFDTNFATWNNRNYSGTPDLTAN